ncbi:MAG TPA: hypothetical protein VK171_16360 [Fimbriimonas sp.]|nr:hypothetical protein [Fimbriimonas sp.]
MKVLYLVCSVALVASLGCQSEHSTKFVRVTTANVAPIKMPSPSEHYFEIATYKGALKNAEVAEAVYEPDPKERTAAFSTLVPGDFVVADSESGYQFWFLQPIFLGPQMPAYVNIQVLRSKDSESAARRKSAVESDVLSAVAGSYILRGPKYWGRLFFLDEGQASWANGIATNSEGDFLTWGIQFSHLPSDQKESAASQMNAMVQNIVFK